MLFAKIVVWWVVLSCVFGPLITMLFCGVENAFKRTRDREADLRKGGAPRAIPYRPLLRLTYDRDRIAHVR